MKYILAFIGLFLSAFNITVEAQESFLFSGTVMDKYTEVLLENATIEIDGQFYTLNASAEFQIYVEMSDIIVFSHLGYMPAEFVISDSTDINNLPSIITLERANITLDEVEVNNNVITEQMTRNAQNVVAGAVEQAKKSDGLSYDDKNPYPGPSGTGLSSSQMLGVNIFSVVDKIKKAKTSSPPAATTRIITYEEYMSSQH